MDTVNVMNYGDYHARLPRPAPLVPRIRNKVSD